MLKRYLLALGPTPVPSEALLAIAMPMIHHRAPDFVPILDAAKKGLQWLFQTKNDILILCSTGTGVIPAALAGLIIGMKAPGAQMIASVTFIAILMTILIQATTTKCLGRKLGLLIKE